MQGRRAPVGRVLLVGLKALAAFAALAVLVALYAHITTRGHVDKPGPLGADVSGGSGDEGSGSGSPGGHMDTSSLWELPAQSPTVSEASPAGPKNGTEPGDIYWQLEETLTEVLGALKEMPDVVELETVEVPQEGHQEVSFPGEKPRAAQPTGGSGVDKRRLGRTKPKAVAGRAHRGAVDAETSRKVLLSNCLVAVAGVLTVLFLCLVVPAWAKDIQGHLATWRARFRPLGSREEVEI
ncbi:uncharacterized protein LOC116799464 isoform X3 [Chiroxiphia lanceolata]|uniref:uncharacterized protein LOC116799464 isoform X3 n=1 Tax=Chiroxiphia lanceolata TaxID=296741 RepID=UPI0013CE6BA5|nr:uncharacterized protein LOC116799464 isoform X3 [Chiroxiphia lanceolata]